MIPFESMTSISVVLIFRARFTKAFLRLWPTDPKFFDTKILLHPSTSKPERPLEPLVRKAALAMVDSVIFWNVTRLTNGGYSCYLYRKQWLFIMPKNSFSVRENSRKMYTLPCAR